MTPADARAIIHRAALTWTDADALTLATVLSLGPPSALHHDTSGLPAVRDTDPGDVPAARPVTHDEGLAADALHVYRIASRRAGVPLPPPGRVAR